MPSKILVAFDTNAIVWANKSGDYGDDPLSSTHQINLVDLELQTARQGNKADMSGSGVAGKIPQRFTVTLRIEFLSAPNISEMVDLYWAASVSNVAATSNPGGTSGIDSAYVGSVGSTLAESLLQLQFIGSLLVTRDAAPTVLQQTFKTIIPLRYGMPVLVNNTNEDFGSDSIEMSINFVPLEYEVQ